MKNTRSLLALLAALALLIALVLPACAGHLTQDDLYSVGPLKPVDSELKVKVGEMAPDFSLPAVGGGQIRLSQYRGHLNVVLSFVPAAWTPVCSEQWPGCNLAEDEFKQRDIIIVGISTDNVPTLHAWMHSMGGLWFRCSPTSAPTAPYPAATACCAAKASASGPGSSSTRPGCCAISASPISTSARTWACSSAR